MKGIIILVEAMIIGNRTTLIRLAIQVAITTRARTTIMKLAMQVAIRV